MLLALEKINVLEGQTLVINDVDWKQFEQILEELGEKRNSRIAYHHHTLEIMTPSLEYERDKVLISTLLEIILEELDIDFWCLGSTTFKSEILQKGLEPDNCFYIQNEAKIRGKKRIDLTIDPPPDLALEVDLTSRTYPHIYSALGVPELWRFEKGNLQINVLKNAQYIEVESSPIFPNIPLKNLIPEFLNQCKTQGRNKTVRAFRTLIKDYIIHNGKTII
ncbi:Uma2 family endonuclease [Cyanobacterium aponinum]|uniref:Uma2 family endonuclease n=1 Tax=Cyanobacterium aponinum 0216 TaxID=2676140 RepID=A0A844GTI4_9CHRO|nr:Uma2 family endonuclease [Cyanobacterium aponinum]MTF38199.1 Uma2 family endonuclease [Cyanobacterium aponinum 0216]